MDLIFNMYLDISLSPVVGFVCPLDSPLESSRDGAQMTSLQLDPRGSRFAHRFVFVCNGSLFKWHDSN